MTVQFATIDRDVMDRLYDRASRIGAGRHLDRMSFEMDMSAAHGKNGNDPLDLRRLLDAPDETFAHDVFGIMAHMDRSTGKIGGHFIPRCTAS